MTDGADALSLFAARAILRQERELTLLPPALRLHHLLSATREIVPATEALLVQRSLRLDADEPANEPPLVTSCLDGSLQQSIKDALARLCAGDTLPLRPDTFCLGDVELSDGLPRANLLVSGRLDRQGKLQLIVVHREAWTAPFTTAERNALTLIHTELLARHIDLTAAGMTLTLAARAREVLTLLVLGRSDKEIAAELRLSPHTVHDHVKSLFQRFSVHKRVALATRIQQLATAAPTTQDTTDPEP